MSFGEFFLKSSEGKKINLNFKGKICREDFKDNKKLLRIFDYFDADKNGVIESLTKEGKNEIANLLTHIEHASGLREGEGNSVLDSQEAFSLTNFIKDLKGISENELFEFLKIVEEKKNESIKENVTVSPDGTKTVINILKDGSVETSVFYPNGELKLRVNEVPIREDFTKTPKTVIADEELYQKQAGEKTEKLTLPKGETEAIIRLTEDSIKYLNQKYNKQIASAYYKDGIMELRDVNDKPVMRFSIDISPEVEQELRAFVGQYLKESSENVLELAKTIGWIDKLGIDLQDISFNKSKLPLVLINPALILTAIDTNGVENLEKYLNQLRDNVKMGGLLESGATTPGAFDSRFERITGQESVNFLQVEQFRQTTVKHQNVQALNQRMALLEEGLKEVKQLYHNYRAKRDGVPNSGKLNSNFDGKILEILTTFFNGDEGVAKALIATISKDIKSKDDLFNKFNDVLKNIKQTAAKSKAEMLNGESEEELKARYEKEYKDLYGQDAVFKAEELITNGKETGGFIQLGMMTAAQMLLAAATMGTGNAALMTLQSNALIGFLTTVGTDYALSLANIITSERGMTQEAREELHQRTLGTATFIGFGMIAANPLARGVGKYVSKLFSKETENLLEGAFAQEAKAGSKAITRTTSGALTKTTLTGDAAFEWIMVNGSKFVTEIGAFSGFELVTSDEEFNKVVEGQAGMLTKLKVMNAALQVLLGSFVKNQALRGQAKLAVKEYNQFLKDMGISDAKLTENKRPGGCSYTLEINGETTTFKDIKELQANFMAIVAESFIKTREIPDHIKNMSDIELIMEFSKLIFTDNKLSEAENSQLVDIYNELINRGMNDVIEKIESNKAEEPLLKTHETRDADKPTHNEILSILEGKHTNKDILLRIQQLLEEAEVQEDAREADAELVEYITLCDKLLNANNAEEHKEALNLINACMDRIVQKDINFNDIEAITHYFQAISSIVDNRKSISESYTKPKESNEATDVVSRSNPINEPVQTETKAEAETTTKNTPLTFASNKKTITEFESESHLRKYLQDQKIDKENIVQEENGFDRFSEQEIEELVDLYKEDKELLTRLVSDNTKKFFGIEQRFNANDIKQIFELARSGNRELVLLALDVKTFHSAAENCSGYMYTVEDIAILIETAKTEPELVKKLVKRQKKEEISPDVYETFGAYSADEISSLIRMYNSGKVNKKSALKYIEAEDHTGNPRYNAIEVQIMSLLEGIDKNLAERLHNEKLVMVVGGEVLNCANYRFENGQLLLCFSSLIQAGGINTEALPVFKRLLDLKKPGNKETYGAQTMAELLTACKGKYNVLDDIITNAERTKKDLYEFDKVIRHPERTETLRKLTYTDSNGRKQQLLSYADIESIIFEPDFIEGLEKNPDLRQFVGKAKEQGGTIDAISSNYVDGLYTLHLKNTKRRETNIYFDMTQSKPVSRGSEVIFFDKNGVKKSTRTFPDGSRVVEEVQYAENSTTKIVGYKKTFFNPQGIQVRSEVMSPSAEKPGEYTIKVIDRAKGEYEPQIIGSTVKTENGTKKHISLDSPDGHKIEQTKETTAKGWTFDYSITDTDGKTELLKINRSFEKIDENHTVSEFNGQKYDVRFEDNRIVASKVDAFGNKTEIITIELTEGGISPQLLSLFKQLPGDYFFKIKQAGLKKIEINQKETDKNNACYNNRDNAIYISEELANDPFTFAHELGHALDDTVLTKLRADKDLQNLYEEDMSAYKSKSSDIEGNSIDYFAKKTVRAFSRAWNRESEAIAELHALTSGLDLGNNDVRSLVLMQNAPRFSVEGAKILEGLKKPRDNRSDYEKSAAAVENQPRKSSAYENRLTEEDIAEMDIEDLQYEAETILQNVPHDIWKDMKNPSWYRTVEILSKNANKHNFFLVDKIFEKFFATKEELEGNETPIELLNVFRKIDNPTTAKLAKFMLDRDISFKNYKDYIELCNEDPEFAYKLCKSGKPIKNHTIKEIYKLCSDGECSQERVNDLLSTTEDNTQYDFTHIRGAQEYLSHIPPKYYDVVRMHIKKGMSDSEILIVLNTLKELHAKTFETLREVHQKHPEWFEGLELEAYKSVDSVEEFEAGYKAVCEVDNSVYEKIPKAKSYVFELANHVYSHWTSPATYKTRIDNLLKISKYDDKTAQTFFKLIKDLETVPETLDPIDGVIEAIHRRNWAVEFNNLDYIADYFKNNNYKINNFVRKAVQTDVDITKTEPIYNEIQAKKEQIVKEVRIKCKDILPEFDGWVEGFLNSKSSGILMFVNNLNVNDLVNNFYHLAKIIKSFEQNIGKYINGEFSPNVIDAYAEYRQFGSKSPKYRSLNTFEKGEITILNDRVKPDFDSKYIEIFRAICATDIETVQQLLNKRLETFSEKVDYISNDVPDSFKPLLANLIRNGRQINKNGQPEKLSGKQKVELIDTIRMYALITKKGNLELSLEQFKKPLEKGTFVLDIDGIRKNAFYEILNNMGMSASEIAELKPENMNWDLSNIYLLSLKIPYDYGELATLVKEATKGNFQNYIKSADNPHGAANIETQRIFAKKHLNYEAWQKGTPEKKIIIAGKEYTIKLWNRIPQESLFDGTYTSCCTALDGGNGGSMANYLLNTAINVVEVRNSAGEVVAMSRCFIAENEHKVPSLIIENIEVNNHFNNLIEKTNTTQNLSEGIFDYMKDFADAIGGKQTPIYMSNSFIKINSSALKEYPIRDKKITLLGKISKEEIYLNTFEEYVETDNLRNKQARFHVIREGKGTGKTDTAKRVQRTEVESKTENQVIGFAQKAKSILLGNNKSSFPEEWQEVIRELPKGGKIQKSFSGNNNDGGADVYLNAEGQVIQKIEYIDREKKTILKVTTMDYDSNGNLISRKYYEEGKLSSEDRFEYDERGNNTVYSVLTPEGHYISQENYEYDSENRIIKKKDFYRKYEYTYEDDGTVKEHSLNFGTIAITKPDGSKEIVKSEEGLKKETEFRNKTAENIKKLNTIEDIINFFKENRCSVNEASFKDWSEQDFAILKELIQMANKDLDIENFQDFVHKLPYNRQNLSLAKRILIEPSSKNNLIYGTHENRFDFMDLYSWENSFKCLSKLLELRETSSNPMIKNFDNLLYIAYFVDKPFLFDVIDLKDSKGNYIIDENNINALREERIVDIIRTCPNARTKEIVDMLHGLPEEVIFSEDCIGIASIADEVFKKEGITAEEAQTKILRARADEIIESYKPEDKSLYTYPIVYEEDLSFYNYLKNYVKNNDTESLLVFDTNVEKKSERRRAKRREIMNKLLGGKVIDENETLRAANRILNKPSLHQLNIKNNLYNKNVNNLRRDIDITLETVQDEHIKRLVKQQLEEIDNAQMNRGELHEKYKDLQEIIDIYNNLSGTYTTITNNHIKNPYYKEFLDYVRKNMPQLAKEITQDYTKFEFAVKKFMSYMTQKSPSLAKVFDNKYFEKFKSHYKEICRDFMEETRIHTLREYCKNNNNELADYMYKDIYLKSMNIPPEIKQQCADIHKKFGVKIFVPQDAPKDTRILEYVSKELQIWVDVSKGKAKLPPTIDFLTAKDDYMGIYAGFSEAHRSGAISLKGFNIKNTIYALRHEITHTNDTKKMNDFPDGIKSEKLVKNPAGIYEKELDIDNCLYADEFKAGKTNHIAYAYTDPMEFIAVASEGDMSKYSPKFKELLVSLGMPRWQLDMPNLEFEVSRESLRKTNPDIKMEDVKYTQRTVKPTKNATVVETELTVEEKLAVIKTKYNFTNEDMKILQKFGNKEETINDINKIIENKLALTPEFFDEVGTRRAALFVNEVMKLTQKYPDIQKNTIIGLVNNFQIQIIEFDNNIRVWNYIDKVIQAASKYPNLKIDILDYLGNKFSDGKQKFVYNENLEYPEVEGEYNVFRIMSNPNFAKIAEITGVFNALTNGLQREGLGYIGIGYEKYDALNEALHGAEPVELKKLKEEFREQQGLELHIDNNIPAQQAKAYLLKVEEAYSIIRASGKEPPKDVYITEFVPEESGGVFRRRDENHNSYSILVKPNEDIEFFKHAVLHETVHMIDRNTLNTNIDRVFRFKRVGIRLNKDADGNIVYNISKEEAAKLQELASKYISGYSSSMAHEFVAEFGTMLLEGKIVIEEFDVEGGIDYKVKIKEPFTKINGKEIKLTEQDRKNIETLVEYYFAIGGQNLSKRTGVDEMAHKISPKILKEKGLKAKSWEEKAKELEIERQKRVAALDKMKIEKISNDGSEIERRIVQLDIQNKEEVHTLQQLLINKPLPQNEKLYLETLLNNRINPPTIKNYTHEQIAAEVRLLLRHLDTVKKGMRLGTIKTGLTFLGRNTARPKSDTSTFDKLFNYINENTIGKKMKDGTIRETDATLIEALSDVRDIYGMRSILEIGDYTKIPEVEEILIAAEAAPTPEAKRQLLIEAAREAAEFQSEELLQALKEQMLKQAQSELGLRAVRFVNYVSIDGIPILSESQLWDLKQFALELGVKEENIKLLDPKKEIFSEEGVGNKDYEHTSKVQNGYTAFQMNFQTRNGDWLEFQCRDKLTSEFAEVEHLIYDTLTGKDIVGRYPEVRDLYNQLLQALDESNLDPAVCKLYRKMYITDYYTYCRAKSVGIDLGEPKLSDYAKKIGKQLGIPDLKLDTRLDVKNLVLLHNLASRVKSDNLTTVKALEIYRQELDKNSD